MMNTVMSIGIRYMISFSWHRKPRWLAPLALWFLGFEKMLKQLEAAVGDCGYRRRPPWKEGTTTRVANYFRINQQTPRVRWRLRPTRMGGGEGGG